MSAGAAETAMAKPLSQANLLGAGTVNLLYSERVYGPEAILSGWVNLSCFLMANSLLFYHMTRVHSLEMDNRVAGIFAIILMLVSTGYTMFAIGPYARRIGSVIKQCLNESKCNNEQANESRWVFYQYMLLGVVTTLIELGITAVMVKKTIQMFKR
jgi:hypothetical protein